jgi:hypothetical protein
MKSQNARSGWTANDGRPSFNAFPMPDIFYKSVKKFYPLTPARM